MKQAANGVVVKASAINKRGVFAARDFRRGEIVVAWENTRELKEDEYAALPPAEYDYIEKQADKILLVGAPERFVNHSCSPNSLPGERCDIAARDIKAGEEITTDYAQFFLPNGPFACNCGSSACRATIVRKTA